MCQGKPFSLVHDKSLAVKHVQQALLQGLSDETMGMALVNLIANELNMALQVNAHCGVEKL
jgi:hypothetical protein